MKKQILLVAAATCMMGAAMAQETVTPKAGDLGTEISFNPFDQNGNTFSLDALKLRYFVTDKDAVRFSLGFGISKETNKMDDNLDAYISATSGDFSIDLGYERHFNVAKRTSVYVGAEAGYLLHFAGGKSEAALEGDNSLAEVTYRNMTPDGDRAYNAFSAGVFTGIDFYVYKGLYVGAELGLNLQAGKSISAEQETVLLGQSTVTEYNDATYMINCAFGVTPTVRLGWTF